MHLSENTGDVASISYTRMSSETGGGQTLRHGIHSSIGHCARGVCHIPGDVLLLNAVLKVLILKLLLVSVGQSKELLLSTAWAGKATGQEEMLHASPLRRRRIPVPHKQKRENGLIKIV